MKTIIAHPNFQYLANELVEKNPETLEHGRVDFARFPDGTPNLFIHNVKETIEHRDVTYIGDFSSNENLFEQLALIRWIVDYYANKVRIIVPYFNCGTMERQSKKGEVATARYLADEFSSLPSGRDAKNSLHTFDIHALQERFYFDSRTINAELHTTMSLIKQQIPKDTVIVFPDEGAAKRFSEDFKEYEKIICSKLRDGDTRKITLKEWNPQGKNVVIVDDLIQSWGTLVETAWVLQQLWAISVKAFAPHGVFPKDSHKRVSWEFDALIVTDTLPENNNRVKQEANMQVLSIASLIEKIILRN